MTSQKQSGADVLPPRFCVRKREKNAFTDDERTAGEVFANSYAEPLCYYRVDVRIRGDKSDGFPVFTGKWGQVLDDAEFRKGWAKVGFGLAPLEVRISPYHPTSRERAHNPKKMVELLSRQAAESSGADPNDPGLVEKARQELWWQPVERAGGFLRADAELVEKIDERREVMGALARSTLDLGIHEAVFPPEGTVGAAVPFFVRLPAWRTSIRAFGGEHSIDWPVVRWDHSLTDRAYCGRYVWDQFWPLIRLLQFDERGGIARWRREQAKPVREERDRAIEKLKKARAGMDKKEYKAAVEAVNRAANAELERIRRRNPTPQEAGAAGIVDGVVLHIAEGVRFGVGEREHADPAWRVQRRAEHKKAHDEWVLQGSPEGQEPKLPTTWLFKGVSSHFVVDYDGTVYQLMDVRHAARHAHSANPTRVGIDVMNRDSFAGDIKTEVWRKYWDGTLDCSGRPIDPVAPRTARGKPTGDYSDSQMRALAHLIRGLRELFGFPATYPSESNVPSDLAEGEKQASKRAEVSKNVGLINSSVFLRKRDPLGKGSAPLLVKPKKHMPGGLWGHVHVPEGDHVCPGDTFDWAYLADLVEGRKGDDEWRKASREAKEEQQAIEELGAPMEIGP